jgi:hypothetical protein
MTDLVGLLMIMIELENMLQGIELSNGIEFGFMLECNGQNIFGLCKICSKKL